MSEQSPYEKLGVTEQSSFEEIQSAKKRLKKQNVDDQQVIESIEAAYDAIIMDRLRMRQEGKIKVPEGIRYPERSVELPPPKPSINLPTTSPDWLQRFIDTPSRSEILWPSGVFLGLSLLAVFGQNDASLLPLLMAIGVAANAYFINCKERKFGRALLITLACLVIGVALGTVLANALGAGAIALGMEQFASLVAFCLFWLASCFLR